MKLYVLIGGWNYEGLDQPVGIFSSKRRAQASMKIAYKGYDSLEIYEYVVDAVPDCQRHEPQHGSTDGR